MPIYEYECRNCGHKFEELVGSNEETVPCPHCQSNDTSKLISLISAKGIADGCSTCAPSSCSSKFR
jgi:putative FmdB family regulatory protein